MKAKAAVDKTRGDIRMVYSSADALTIAQANPGKQVVFFAIGFETTTPPTAVAIKAGTGARAEEFLGALLPRTDAVGDFHHSRIAGGPPVGHRAARRFHRPGARLDHHRQPPLRVLRRGIPEAGGDCRLRAARRDAGNPDAGEAGQRRACSGRERVLAGGDARRQPEGAEPRRRGVRAAPPVRVARAERRAVLPGLRIRKEFAEFDAEKRFPVDYVSVADNKACECGAILRGVKKPQDCKLFGTVYAGKPDRFVHGVVRRFCAAHYTYGRYKDFA